MKFILFVEGHTENQAIASFLKRWLDPKLSINVGIKPVRFEGWADLVSGSPAKAKLHLAQEKVIAVVALLDLYGPSFYPEAKKTVCERYEWAKNHLEQKVGQEKFFQFFAVHEVEAWLLSDPSIFPKSIEEGIRKMSGQPESINGSSPPAKRLDAIYRKETGKGYKKVVHGMDLFSKLDPTIAYDKCPHLKKLLDKMLVLAKEHSPKKK